MKARTIGVIIGLWAGIAGCGGTGDTALFPSQYNGPWSGTWASGDAGEGGGMAVAITADGSLSGTMNRGVTAGSVSGLIDRNGRLTAVASFPEGGNMVIGGAVQLTGGRLIGSFNYVKTGIQYAGTFDCTSGAVSGGS